MARSYIVTPVYKARDFLENTVRSVQNQTCPDFCLILVEDGSPDDSGSLCEKLAAEDSRIHVIHQKNTGPFGARQAGIRYALAHGSPEDVLLFLDSDDALRPDALETVQKTISETGCDLVLFHAAWLSGSQVVEYLPPLNAFTGTLTDRRELYKTVFGTYHYNSLCTKAAKLRLFDRDEHPEWYAIRSGEDLLQSLCLFRNTGKTVFLPDVLYDYTLNLQSLTNTVRYDTYRSNAPMLQAVWDFLKSENIWSEEDFSEYLIWCRTLTRIEIWTIAKFETTLKNRYNLLNRLREDAYFGMVLSSATIRQPDLILVRNEVFFPLCLTGSCLKALGNLRRWVRRHLK